MDVTGARSNAVDEKTEYQARVYGAKKSALDVDGSKTATRRVEFEGVRDRDASGGNPRHLATMTHRACDCDDADIDVSYRMCCISANNNPPFKAATLFDTGAHASVNREVAAWIGTQNGPAKQLGARKRGWQDDVVSRNLIEQSDTRKCCL